MNKSTIFPLTILYVHNNHAGKNYIRCPRDWHLLIRCGAPSISPYDSAVMVRRVSGGPQLVPHDAKKCSSLGQLWEIMVFRRQKCTVVFMRIIIMIIFIEIVCVIKIKIKVNCLRSCFLLLIYMHFSVEWFINRCY